MSPSSVIPTGLARLSGELMALFCQLPANSYLSPQLRQEQMHTLIHMNVSISGSHKMSMCV
eukprot:scaffold9249_cov86-Skeletonema_dohrnii-CCMP3373.AAC.4